MNFPEQFHTARLKSVPLIAIRTLDPMATIRTLAVVTNGDPILVWDCIRGIAGFNEAGRSVADVAFKDVDPIALANPVEALVRSVHLPAKTILFMINGHTPMKSPEVIQAMWNLRDLYKQDRRTLCVLAPDITLPAELAQDVVILDEPLPDTADLAAIVIGTFSDAQMDKPKDAIIVKAVDAICGLASFAAEQVCAMSISQDGLDLKAMWEHKRQQIENTGGLTVYRGKEKTGDVKGAENVVEYLKKIMANCACVVFIDEIEKMFSGMGNDQDSTTKEMVGKFLTWCDKQDSDGELMICGVLLLGPSGVGKSMIAKAIGNEYERPTIVTDFSGMKDSLYGESQQNQAQALKIIDAVAGDKRKLVIATCNSLTVLPPELRRRFNFGTFFVDLPNADARGELWNQYMNRYKIHPKAKMPDDTGWTGAEIRDCCRIAHRINCSLAQAATYIVPVSTSASEQIEKLRREASGRFIAADKPGLYRSPEMAQPNAFPQGARRDLRAKN